MKYLLVALITLAGGVFAAEPPAAASTGIEPKKTLEPFCANPDLRGDHVPWKTVKRFTPRDELFQVP